MSETGDNGGKLRAGVIGAGFFGGLHARKYASLPGIDFVAVMDPVAGAAGKIAAEYGASVVGSVEELADHVDLVSITAPACHHFELAEQALNHGLHVYIEKPIALDVEEADRLIQLADQKNLQLQVGHQERYVMSAFGLLSRNRTPVRIECKRAGPFTGRAMDVSVVLDLMIHDLDLVHQVAPAPVEQVQAISKRVHGEHEDEVDTILKLSDGCQVHLMASRIADARERFMKLEYDDGYVEIDFISRTLVNTTKADLESAFESKDENLPAVADDPLGYAIGSFVASVQTDEEPFVTGTDARRALATALTIIEVCQEATAN